jgi:acyl-CoA thioesterase
MSLELLLAGSKPLDDGPSASLGTGFALEIPPDWHQGRTAYGGLSAALALAAARQVGGEVPPLRSAQVSFVGPLHGEVEVRARVLRSGKNATWIAAEILREGEVGLAASFVFMGPVQSSLHLNDCGPPSRLIPVDEARELTPGGFSPTFLRNHFEVRFALPRSDEKRPEFCWWLRPKRWQEVDPVLAPVLCADGVPPGVLPLMNPGVLVSTMTWQLNMLTPAPATREGWWLLRSVGTYAQAGCSSQQMQLWNADGEPALSAIQSVALFG